MGMTWMYFSCMCVCLCVFVCVRQPCAFHCTNTQTHTHTDVTFKNYTLWWQCWLDPGSSPGQPCPSHAAHDKVLFEGKTGQEEWKKEQSKDSINLPMGQYAPSVTGREARVELQPLQYCCKMESVSFSTTLYLSPNVTSWWSSSAKTPGAHQTWQHSQCSATQPASLSLLLSICLCLSLSFFLSISPFICSIYSLFHQ